MKEDKFLRNHIIIFFCLIPYYLIGALLVYFITYSIFDEEHADIPFIYVVSIHFYIPILFYLFMSLKYLWKKNYLRGSLFILILIFILSCYYFPKKNNLNNFSQIFTPYFMPWVTAKKINDELEVDMHKAQHPPTVEELQDIKRREEAVKKSLEMQDKMWKERDAALKNKTSSNAQQQ